jgi:serine/threonine protein kinase
MSLALWSRLGQYEIVSQLGQGGMGIVFRARDTKLERDVAVKVLFCNLAEDKDALPASSARRSGGRPPPQHPPFTTWAREGTVYATMELLECETLR